MPELNIEVIYRMTDDTAIMITCDKEWNRLDARIIHWTPPALAPQDLYKITEIAYNLRRHFHAGQVLNLKIYSYGLRSRDGVQITIP